MRKERRVSVLSGEAGRDKEKTSRAGEAGEGALTGEMLKEVSVMYCELLP
jgi:hypothetical protein